MRSSFRFAPFVVVTGGFLILAQPSCGHPDVPDGASNSSGGSMTSSGGGGTGAVSGAVGNGGSEVIIGGGSFGGAPPKMACTDANFSDKYSPGYTAAPDPQVAQILGRMSLAQKIAQMQGVDPGPASSLQYDDIQASEDVDIDSSTTIRGYMYRDGPRGLNLDALQRGRESATSYSTLFPVTVARSATFDPELEYQVGEAMGDETAASRNTMLLVPCMNILRHPLWGRAQETYGEDNFQIGRMASALAVGVQQYVSACAKHFAANNIENGRMSMNADMDEQTLRETYGRHFRMVVQDSGVACVMASYNLINGTKSTQNKHLLTEILREDFGFRGLVLSDWWAMPPGQSLAPSATAQDNAAVAVEAGLDLEVPWKNNFAQLQAVVPSRISEAQINTAAGYILEQKFRFHSALGKRGDNNPLSLRAPTTTLVDGQIAGNQTHIDLAQKVAAEGMVLLKNDNATLPIKIDGSVKSVAVVGLNVDYTLRNTSPNSGTLDFARELALGDRGSSRANADPGKTTGAQPGIQAAATSHDVTVTASNGVDSAVMSADFVVVMVGNTPADEGEEYSVPSGGDRADFSLSAAQNDLVTQVAALGKPMVVVIEAGAMVSMPWLSSVPAVVMAWYPGQAGGLALGQLLFGDVNFSGRLPITWGNSVEELPLFRSPSSKTTPMGYYVGYKYYDHEGITPVRPFGFGLSYTTFSYSNLQVPCETVTTKGVINVQVDITNTGSVPGDEVAMLFVSFPDTQARRPAKELKGFYRVSLEPGMGKRITIPVRVKDLDYFDMASNQWVTEAGTVNIMVGPNAATLPLTGSVQVVKPN